MKVQIPDELKQSVPPSGWGKILTATPVIMTVLATALAGLASSEMTRAQYARSLGAQEQAKAGDQWGYFQAKRLRASMQRTTFDLIQALAGVHPLGAEVTGRLDPAIAAALQQGQPPPPPPPAPLEPAVKSALDLLAAGRPDADLNAALSHVSAAALAHALLAAQGRVDAFDAATASLNQSIDALEKSLAGSAPETVRDVTAARARYSAARYDAEARLNQSVAEVIELQVRQSNLIADRHHRRSQRFFFGMLAAQAAVIVSTFSLAAQKRSMLWTLAAAAGLAAVGFAIYVYFYV